MKKYFALIGIMCIFLVGCGKYNEKDIVSDLNKKIEKLDSYYLTGELEIINNEDSYLYDVEVSYEKENNFRVSLKNKTNNHEQIILRNSDGIYVLTPSLNKSFKFQSEWPYNNSQIYLLQTILKDINEDENKQFEEKDGQYVLTTKVNYSNNTNLVKQKIYVDKNIDIKEIQILDETDVTQMKMKFNDIDYKATYNDTYFALNNNLKPSNETISNTLDDITYPMYMPVNTHLSDQEKVSTLTGERVILTFAGENPFMVVQETSSVSEEFLTIPIYGEPYIITGCVGALSDTSITWSNSGVDYYVISNTMNQEQLLEVANSINVMSVGK